MVGRTLFPGTSGSCSSSCQVNFGRSCARRSPRRHSASVDSYAAALDRIIMDTFAALSSAEPPRNIRCAIPRGSRVVTGVGLNILVTGAYQVLFLFRRSSSVGLSTGNVYRQQYGRAEPGALTSSSPCSSCSVLAQIQLRCCGDEEPSRKSRGGSSSATLVTTVAQILMVQIESVLSPVR